MSEVAAIRFLKELRRRRVFRVAGLYVVGVWLLMQAANILLPAWEIPDRAIRYLLYAALLGFPVALTFGWIFQVTAEGIRRTRPEWSQEELQAAVPLRRTDYLVLAAFVLVMGWIGYEAFWRIADTSKLPESRPTATEFAANSLAVLPFASLSTDPEHEYFADGISEEILNRLAAFRELTVIARTSSFTFKNSGYDIGRISGLLGVKYLLQGSVRRDGQQLRISAQLVDRSGVQVWSQTFDRQLGTVFALQDEIAQAVATSIVPHIAPPAPAERLPDPEAYDAYLNGREILARRGSVAGIHALPWLDRAIELDPGFAEAYAERAAARVFIFDFSGGPNLDESQRDIELALALKPELARAHAVQALLMSERRDGGPVARESALRKALALDPNQVDAWNWLGGALSEQGRMEEAEEAMRRSVRLDPLAPSPNANLAAREVSRGQVDEAERRLLRLLEVPQPSQLAYFALYGLYVGDGRLVDALQIAERMMLAGFAGTGRPSEVFVLMGANGTLGRREQALYWRERSKALYPDDDGMRLIELFLVSLHAGILDHCEALAEVDTLFAHGRLDIDRAPSVFVANFGELLALCGDHPRALRVLEPAVAANPLDMPGANRMRQALAWSYLQLGERDKVLPLLEPLERHYREAYEAGRLRLFNPGAGYIGGGLAGYAMTALLAGNEELALERLELAAEQGWRGYYGIQADPRWASMREHPRYQALMQVIKADVDEQRARAEAIDTEQPFVARFDAALQAAQGHQ